MLRSKLWGEIKYCVALCSFLFFIPMYVVYQSVVQFGIIPPFAGGYFAIGVCVSLIFGFVYWAFFCRAVGFLGEPVFWVFNFFIAIVVWRAVFGWLINDVDTQIVFFSLLNMVCFLSIFFVVLCLEYLISIFSMRMAISFFIYVFFVVAVVFSENGQFYEQPYFDSSGYYFEFNYQNVAFCMLFLVLMIVPVSGARARLFLYAASVPGMYFLGARAEFYAFFLLVGVVEWYRARAVYLAVALCAAITLLIFFLLFGEVEVLSGRMFSALLGEDASMSERDRFTASALSTISENPIMGSYGGYAAGQYAHNFLSLWVDLGIFSFLFFLVLFFMAFDLGFASALVKKTSVSWLRAFTSMVLVCFMLVFAKSYTYFMVPVCFSLYCIYRIELRCQCRVVQ